MKLFHYYNVLTLMCRIHKFLKVVYCFSLCCEGEVAVTNTLSMALSPTGVWRRPPALPVRTSVSSAGGNELETETATTLQAKFHTK